MNRLLQFFAALLILLLITPLHSFATETSSRSTSLGTGLPTDNSKYERPDLKPKPTIELSTDYEWIDTEDDDDKTYSDSEDSKKKDNGEESTDNQNAAIPSSKEKEQSSSTKKDNVRKEVAKNDASMTTLPKTGEATNYFSAIGVVFVLIAILLLILFFIRQKKK